MIYNAYGLNIHSEIKLQGIPENYNPNYADIKLVKGKVDLPQTALVTGKNFKSFEDSLYLFWDDVGIFKIENGSKITIEIEPFADKEFIQMFIMGTVMGVLLQQRGYHIFHASASNIKGKAVAFLGNSGFGKSTLAMSLYEMGNPVICDDYLPVIINQDNIKVKPGFPRLKLSKEVIDSKGIDPKEVIVFKNQLKSNYVKTERGFLPTEIPFRGIYILESGKNLSIKTLKPQKALKNLLAYSYTIKSLPPTKRVNNLQDNSFIVDNIPVKLLTIPHDLNCLKDVSQTIVNDVTKDTEYW